MVDYPANVPRLALQARTSRARRLSSGGLYDFFVPQQLGDTRGMSRRVMLMPRSAQAA